MTIQQQKDFLIRIAYWTLIIAAVYLAFDYLLPISVPFILGILIAWVVVRITKKLHCSHKLLPFVTLCYDWVLHRVNLLDPAIISTPETLLEGLLSTLKSLVGYLSGVAVNLVSSIATGVPSLIFSILAMVFSTMFVVADYEQIASFANRNTPKPSKIFCVMSASI